MSTRRSALAEAVRRLEQAGVEDAQREALWLFAAALGSTAGAVRADLSRPVAADEQEAFLRLVARRADREPIQYILGTEEFMGMTFRVTPDVLIPRLDTETLVRQAAERLQGAVRVADIGTGSGAIAVRLAALLPEATVVAVDISPAALAVARENAANNGVADRIQFRQGDLLAPLAGEAFDAILSNPPYIPATDVAGLMPEVREWEPQVALTPGADGLLFYRCLAEGAGRLIRPGGFLAVEVGFDQAGAVATLFAEAGLQVSVHQDTAGIDRVVIGWV